MSSGLRTHPFDELWRAAAGGVAAHWGLPEPEVRDVLFPPLPAGAGLL
ncbi:hypothetical protein AB0N06_24410 [Streptomyces sp. NPDC051020]